MNISQHQDHALQTVSRWYSNKSSQQVFYLAGYAGTGKTTIAKHFAESVGYTLFCAFTGKAALVMQRKGCVNASTIHSLIYKVESNKGIPNFFLNQESEVKYADLVVVDECSMVGRDLGEDLLSFGCKVLVLGDPAQLPPVNSTGFFTSREPDFMLTEIHRQAAENPIIRMSMDVREGRGLQYGSYGTSKVIPLAKVDKDEILAADEVLVGLNRTRRTYNKRIRKLRGFPEQVSPGDKLICLRNNHKKGLLNGGLWTASEVLSYGQDITLIVTPIDAGASCNPQKVIVNHLFFEGREHELDWKSRQYSDEFYFGEAITVHKSQGSQWDDLYVFDESGAFREDAQKHLYTAVTRAAERITVAR
jgi:exodeoxyribonuclease-5